VPIDRRGILQDGLFSYRASKEGAVFISYAGRQVTILRGKAAEKLLRRIGGLHGQALQLELAKVTGNFKRGNERG
jgi:hypothetical protein